MRVSLIDTIVFYISYLPCLCIHPHLNIVAILFLSLINQLDRTYSFILITLLFIHLYVSMYDCRTVLLHVPHAV
jgi:hypothetical protein